MITHYEKHASHPPLESIVTLAKTLHVSADALLGMKTVPEGPRHPQLWRRLKQVEELPYAKRRAVMEYIEMLVEKHDRRNGRDAE